MKLTEEQFKQLKNLNDSKVNEILGFNTLVVGKWYKANYNGREWLLIYNDGKYASGFLGGYYNDNFWSFSPNGGIAEEVIPATKEEVEEALIKEAKKRGFENIGDLSLIFPYGTVFKKGDFKTYDNEFRFFEKYNALDLDGVRIFKDGEWAEIKYDKSEVKEEIKQLEQRLKELRDELI